MAASYEASSDAGSRQLGVNLEGTATGNPIGVAGSSSITVGHTLAIIIGALALIWLFGGVIFRKIRV